MVSQMKLLHKKYKNKEDLKNKLINNTIDEISNMSQEEWKINIVKSFIL